MLQSRTIRQEPVILFSGWFSDSALTQPFSFATPITGTTQLYAKWTIIIYTVSFSSNGGSAITSQSIAYGSVVSKPGDPAKTGYTFNGWFSDSNLTLPFSFATQIVGDTMLYAGWTPNVCTVTPTSGVNGSISPVTAQTVNYGKTVNFTVTPNSGYKIVAPIGGTCPQGTLNGTTYATGAIVADCTMAVGFGTINIIPVAGNGTIGYSGDGDQSILASINNPVGIAVDGAGNIYFADSFNSRVRKVAIGTGVITTIAGTGAINFSGDNGPAASASLYYPYDVAIDTSGNLLIADNGNNRIRRVDARTGVITTVAGNGTKGYSGDNGPATSASLNGPLGVSFDTVGNLYIADTFNSRIRKVAIGTGIITTIAGNGTAGFSGDNGPAAAASIYYPYNVAADSAGNLFIADNGNNRIRKVDAVTGAITTVAGNGTKGYSGDNGPATSASLNGPLGVSFDTAGNLYVADTSNNRIRQVAAVTGTITTIAGNGTADYSGDYGPATLAHLNGPGRVTVDGSGNIYIADGNNKRIRKILAASPFANPIGKAGDCDANGTVSIAEVQNAINMFLGLKTIQGCVDIDGSGTVSISEVQKAINAFLGL